MIKCKCNDDDDACDLGDGQQGQGCYARGLQRRMAQLELLSHLWQWQLFQFGDELDFYDCNKSYFCDGDKLNFQEAPASNGVT